MLPMQGRLGALAGLLFVACVNAMSIGSVQADPARVGVILPLSGELASNGDVVFAAYDIAREMANAREGEKGKSITFERGDSPDPAAAQQNARNMVGHGTRVVMGSLANNLGLAASSVVERGGGTYFETTAVSEEFTNRGLKHVFRASTPGASMGSTAIDFVAQDIARDLKKPASGMTVAIVYEPNWQLIAEAAKATAGRHGMKVVVYTDYDSKSLDFAPLVAQLKAANPDVVLAGGWLNDSVLLNKQSKQVGFWPKAWVGLSGGHSIKEYASNLGANSTGVYVVNAPSTVADSGLNAEGRALKAEFLKRWAQRHKGEAPGGLAYEAFGNAWVLMHEALPKAKSDDPQDVRNALMAVNIEPGGLPNGTGAKFAQDGSNERTFFTVLQWQDQELATVWPEKLATKKPIAPKNSP